MASPLRIAVVGSGAIGTYYGGKLASGGLDLRFLVRSGLSAIRDNGLQIRGPNEDVRIAKVNCYSSTIEIGPVDLVLIAVKTTSNPDLPELISPLLHENTLLLTLQNGLGNEEFLAKHFGPERVLGGLCFICLNRSSPGMVERFDHGLIKIGEHSGPSRARTHQIALEFQHCGIKCDVIENLALERWRKLVWNIPFNGLSVLGGGIDTATILGSEELRRAAVDLMEEVISGANKCGFPLGPSDAAELIGRTETMGPYKPSTLRDFEAGKPLEIEAIWGEPLRRAQAAGANMVRTQSLYSMLQSLDRVERG